MINLICFILHKYCSVLLKSFYFYISRKKKFKQKLLRMVPVVVVPQL